MGNVFDCAVLGAGASGLSASLTLGRSRRTVALFDNGTNRNRVTQKSHGFLTRDGIKPADFKDLALKELEQYPSVHFYQETILDIKKQSNALFKITTSSGNEYFTEKIIIATGIQEEFPQVPKIREFYGKSLFSCPYCDGWELKNKPLLVITENKESVYSMARTISNWSRDLVIATNGYEVPADVIGALREKGVLVITEPIERLDGENGYLEKVVFSSGIKIDRIGGFVEASHYRPNQFIESLGCETLETGAVVTDDLNRTSQKNIYVAGEAAQGSSSSLIISAAEGNKAGVAVNMDTIEERF